MRYKTTQNGHHHRFRRATALSRVVVIGLVLLTSTSEVFAQWQSVGPVTNHQVSDSTLAVQCGDALLSVTAMSDHVIRVRMTPDGSFGRDFSWAVLDLAPQGRLSDFTESPAELSASTSSLAVRIERDPCRIQITDSSGRVLVADDMIQGMSWLARGPRENNPTRPIRVSHALTEPDAVYGLGEKSGPFDKLGQTLINWNTDAWGYGPATDPLYKSVPFFIVADDGKYHGVFFDNPWRASFDFGRAQRDLFTYTAEGGELNYYVIAGPHPKEVITRYTQLTGRIDLPPLWTLGYHQCRYSYYPESRVREIAETFRKKRIPCDVIYFDIDYMDGYRPFTWSPEHFPDPKKLTDDLRAMGFHTIAIIDPGIKVESGYSVYDSGEAIGAWLRQPDGKPYIGRVWPGDTVFPDYTNPKVRDWWAGLFPPFLDACGIDGVWNDMNEPANFAHPSKTVPLDLVHDNEGEPATHHACHNVYGMQMARATQEGISRARPGQRPFTMTRASYAGGQRFGAAWTGDNWSTWEHLQLSVTMILNMGVSGMPFVGPDIGGFVAGATPQLYARWIQVGSLFPYSRTHTAKGNPDQEPWSYGPEVEAIARESLELRYSLLPYLYTLFEESSRNGLPIMRPMWLEDSSAGDEDQAFLLGRDIYVVPTLWPDARDRHIWLPKGVWFDFHSDQIHASGQPVRVSGALDHLPMFVRAGAIVPRQSPVQSTSETPQEPLIVDVWLHGDSSGELYEDDGATFAYRNGEFRRTRFTCNVEDRSIAFEMIPEGPYKPSARTPLVRFHGIPDEFLTVSLTVGDEQRQVDRVDLKREETPNDPASFGFDVGSRNWLVRLAPDEGQPQRLSIQLADRASAAHQPVDFEFACDDKAELLPRGFDEPTCRENVLEWRVMWSDFAQLVIPPVRFNAQSLPVMKLRLSTESTTQVNLRFATHEQPLLSDQDLIRLNLTPDGQMHEYTLDLDQAANGQWRGMVYYIDLRFDRGTANGEEIRIERLAFEPQAGE